MCGSRWKELKNNINKPGEAIISRDHENRIKYPILMSFFFQNLYLYVLWINCVHRPPFLILAFFTIFFMFWMLMAVKSRLRVSDSNWVTKTVKTDIISLLHLLLNSQNQSLIIFQLCYIINSFEGIETHYILLCF